MQDCDKFVPKQREANIFEHLVFMLAQPTKKRDLSVWYSNIRQQTAKDKTN